MILTGRRRVMLGAAGIGALAALGAGLEVACSRGETAVDRHKILEDAAQVVIVPVYEDAATEAARLATAMDRLATTPDAPSLTAATEAWRAARSAWKRSDAFVFGPADDLAITGGVIDAGPPDVAKIDAFVSATTPIDATAVASLGGNQRGFAGLEALLFDPAGGEAAVLARFVGAPGDRRRTFGALCARDLRAKIEAVRDAWLPGKGDYAGALARAGRGSTVYSAERQGIDAIVNALAGASEVLIAIRLAKPLGLDQSPAAPHPELVESGRADASLADIVAVLEGIEMLYTCTRDGARGVPLGDAVREFRPTADDDLRADLGRAKAAVLAVPPPLRVTISTNREPAVAAHAAIREIKRRLTTEIAGALGTTVGFGVTDGD